MNMEIGKLDTSLYTFSFERGKIISITIAIRFF